MDEVDPKDEAVQRMMERFQRMPKETSPKGQPYHVLVAERANGELTSAIWMGGPEGGVPVFESLEDGTEALRYTPSPREAGYGDDAVRWRVCPLSGPVLRTLYLNPNLTLYRVLSMSEEGLAVQRL
ncbi:hypothetical protein JY651_35420 [Pyxidicoccus parkwayensis]|jgi:hypothetical protein|uniref:Uncharacterized protein n=1 Tax=Pyxidicoccus parkwayensis TaxID=2813578 RepID=A0ABX7NQ48_9BACT|nr:hypothetical protein [Pyxidicoccus parkwaysis]QSQ20499.1 hypothetical protein JY651_35420 [Pyxidicoccus parkwaysis]